MLSNNDLTKLLIHEVKVLKDQFQTVETVIAEFKRRFEDSDTEIEDPPAPDILPPPVRARSPRRRGRAGRPPRIVDNVAKMLFQCEDAQIRFNNSCPICQDNINSNNCLLFICGHSICSKPCGIEWVRRHRRNRHLVCPLCRGCVGICQ